MAQGPTYQKTLADPSQPADPGALDALSSGVDKANAVANGDEDARKKEENVVKEQWEEYDTARKFDKDARRQYAIDRRYAAGTADLSWAVTTNLIGSYIDILVSFLYARDPDVSAKKAEQVSEQSTQGTDAFAKTLQIVVSKLWKQSKLKAKARKMVRSSLSVGPGWLKAIMICDGPNLPQMQTDLDDSRTKLAELTATHGTLLTSEDEMGNPLSTDEIDVEIATQNELINSIQSKMEASVRKQFAVDFVAAEDIQVSLDVGALEDYLDADWVANAIYRPKKQLLTMFPRLKAADIQSAKGYFRKKPKSQLTPIGEGLQIDGFGDGNSISDTDAEQYTTGTSSSSSTGEPGEDGIEFAKVVELWDHRTNHVKTMIEGVKCWAKEPYEPDYPSTRFYPYFQLAFYEVDGARHPQSLSWRLTKLQDEYARSRSNFRTSRERSIPATMFNADGITPEDAAKIQNSTLQELIALRPVQPETPLSQLFAAKPVSPIDPRLYDNAPILADMEKVAGVQEALQSAQTNGKTATEANIQQTGFASRTNADRDKLETLLTDMATYTGELSLTALTTKDAQRFAGPAAFWPAGMSIDDLLTMVELDIEAGSTGKPRDAGDKEAWGVILPQIHEAIIEIQKALIAGNVPMANALTELLRTTMVKMGDHEDIDRFIPGLPPPQPPPPPPQIEPPKVSISLKGEDLPPGVIPLLIAPDLPPPPPPAGVPGIPDEPGAANPGSPATPPGMVGSNIPAGGPSGAQP